MAGSQKPWASQPMRSRNILAALAIFLCLCGCQSDEYSTLPDELVGVYKTSAPGYEDNSLELRKDEIVFGVGDSKFTVNRILRVKIAPEAEAKTFLITIGYSDQNGEEKETSLIYDQRGAESIRFKNQPQIEWTLFQRKPPEIDLLQGARARPSQGSFNWNIALAMFGIALVIGAALMRMKKSTAEEPLPGQSDRAGTGLAQPAQPKPEPAQPKPEPAQPKPEARMSAVPAIAVQEQRRSERLLLKIPLRVAGTDVRGNSFTERTYTISINRDGAYVPLKGIPRPGDHVSVTNLGTKQTCMFRLCESGKDASGEVTAWGIECLEPDANFWQIHFPEKPAEPSPLKRIVALIMCATCHSREVAELSVADYRQMHESGSMKRDCSNCADTTEWKFILVEPTSEVSQEEVSSVSRSSAEEKRIDKRILAKLPICLRHPEDGRVENTLTENVSKTGVCCAASMELKVYDVILLRFDSDAGPNEEEIPARIMWRRSVGEGQKEIYGIRFERRETRAT